MKPFCLISNMQDFFAQGQKDAPPRTVALLKENDFKVFLCRDAPCLMGTYNYHSLTIGTIKNEPQPFPLVDGEEDDNR